MTEMTTPVAHAGIRPARARFVARAGLAGLLAIAAFALVCGAFSARAAAATDVVIDVGNSGSTATGQLNPPRGVAVDPGTGHVYVADQFNNRISVFTYWREFLRTFGWDVVASGPGDSNAGEQQQVTIAAGGGTFTLTFNGYASFGGPSTAPLPHDATAQEVEDALNALDTIGGAGGSVTVSGGPGDADGSSPYEITFGGDLGGDNVDQLSLDASRLAQPVGAELSCSTGTAAETITYRWLRNGSPIAGATAGTYTTVAADAGAVIQCQVFATNPNSGATQVSSQALVVAPYPATPPTTPPGGSLTPPEASAGLTVGGSGGQTLTCDPLRESWKGQPSFSYRWYRNGSQIAGATSRTYTVTAADLATPAGFQCEIRGTNAGGTASKIRGNLTTDPAPSSPSVPTASASLAAPFSSGVTTVAGGGARETCVPADGDVCKAGVSGPRAGQLASPQGAALDGSGNVWVTEISSRRVQKFGPDGQFLLMIGGGVNQGGGSPANPGNLCTAQHLADGDTCGAGTQGSDTGQFGDWPNVSQGSSYIAVSPTDDVWVGDEGRIQRFNLSGVYQDEIALPGQTVSALAVDPSGNLYAAFGGAGNVKKLSPAGTDLATVPATNPYALATDGDGNLYLADGNAPPTVRVFSSAGTQIDSFQATGVLEPRGIATHAVTEAGETAVYVSNNQSGGGSDSVRIYSPVPDTSVVGPPPSVPPTIAHSYAVSVSGNEAQLRARINPHFWTDTSYYVEWGTEPCSGPGASCAQVPASPGAPLTAQLLDVPVTTQTVPLGGLQPGTTYHYRFVADSSGGGPVFGADRSFHTVRDDLAPGGACPNAEFRIGPGALLPDCRAYEMVSPVDKRGGNIQGAPEQINTVTHYTSWRQAAAGGERVTYTSDTSFGDAISSVYSNQYLSTRTPEGWTTHGISQRRGVGLFEGVFPPIPVVSFELDAAFQGFTSDLCHGWVVDANVEPLTPDGLEGYVNIYRRDNCGPDADTYQALTNEGPVGEATKFLNHPTFVEPSPGATGPGLRFQGASDDLSHQLFVSGAQLIPEAAPGNSTQLYDFHNGQLELVSVLPNGEPDPANSVLGTMRNANYNRESSLNRAVSRNGSRIFWSSNAVRATDPGRIYVRVGGDQTLPVSVPPGSPDDEPVNAVFITAAADGSAALFSVGASLYLFDTEAALSGDPEPVTLIAAGVRGVLGASEDLGRIYFVSEQQLAPGGQQGERNLYLREGDDVSLVAVLHENDVRPELPLNPVSEKPLFRASRVTADGEQIAFQSFANLTGYESVDHELEVPFSQVFHYDAADDVLICVSCNPTGARPSGEELTQPFDDLRGGFHNMETTPHASGVLPTWEREQYGARALSDDGNRVYFHSYEALVPWDTNGAQDVYQWEAEGTGDCGEPGGCVRLISTGKSPKESVFYDASADGEGVFFTTWESIDPRDEGQIDVYDARVGGGFPPPPPEPAGCEGEACRGASPNSPTDLGAGSAVFEGQGNPPRHPARPGCNRLGRKAKRTFAIARRAARKGQAKRARALRRKAGKLRRRATGCRRAARAGADRRATR